MLHFHILATFRAYSEHEAGVYCPSRKKYRNKRMLRLSDRGIPPHMLHLYENAHTHPKSDFKDDVARLPAFLTRFSSQVLSRLTVLRAPPKPDFAPDSAKSNTSGPCETQYLGSEKMRDTRWHAQ